MKSTVMTSCGETAGTFVWADPIDITINTLFFSPIVIIFPIAFIVIVLVSVITTTLTWFILTQSLYHDPPRVRTSMSYFCIPDDP